MKVEDAGVEFATIVVGTPVATEVEGDPLDFEGGSVPSNSPVAPAAGVEETLPTLNSRGHSRC